MKLYLLSLGFILFLVLPNISTSQELSPYINVGTSNLGMDEEVDRVNKALQSYKFDIIGSYSPENKPNFKVIVFTREDLQSTLLKVEDRGLLASALKVGLISNEAGITVSYLNPKYIFNAYLRGEYSKHSEVLNKVELDVKASLSPLGTTNEGFGGSLSVDKLRKYHYKITMPYFDDPIELMEFNSFEEGVAIIEKNLKAKKSDTKLVYKINFESSEVCVFGVGLLNNTTGESKFLPIIGEDHIAAMPYEIIIQGKTATMLHGRFRIALHWPELSMGTFMKIMSTPGDIEDTLKELCQ